MRLDRNIADNGRGKYALLKLRELDNRMTDGPFRELDPEIAAALQLLTDEGILDDGEAGTSSEFFVIRLRDKYAKAALQAYAAEAATDDPEYAREVSELASRSGLDSPFCKSPD